MQNLQAALEELKDTILTDGFEPGLVEEIAIENDLNPTMLRRKFVELTKQAPESYSRATGLPSGSDIRDQINALEKAKLEVVTMLVLRDIKKSGTTKKQFLEDNGTDAYEALVLKYKYNPKMEELAKEHLAIQKNRDKSMEELSTKLGKF